MSFPVFIPVEKIAEDVWKYPNRDLTRIKYPFWSAIIMPTLIDASSIPASSTANFDVQPPQNETWLLYIITKIHYSYNVWMEIKITNGTTETIMGGFDQGNTPPEGKGTFIIIIDSDIYLRFTVTNNAASPAGVYIGYCGFKLSQPKWKPQSVDPIQWKKKTDIKLPKELEELADMVFDVYDWKTKKYRPAIIIEENVPIAIDPNTMFPVHRKTTYVFLDEFINLIKLISTKKIDLDESGWKPIFDKWIEKGISLAKRLFSGSGVG